MLLKMEMNERTEITRLLFACLAILPGNMGDLILPMCLF